MSKKEQKYGIIPSWLTVKKEHMVSCVNTVDRRGFFVAKKGQTFTKYSEELKKEAVRLHLEEHMSYSQILEKLDIKSDAQLVRWIRKFKSGETFEDRRGTGGRKHFDSKDEEIAYLKAQVEYLKKLNPNLHGEGSWIQIPGVNPFKK